MAFNERKVYLLRIGLTSTNPNEPERNESLVALKSSSRARTGDAKAGPLRPVLHITSILAFVAFDRGTGSQRGLTSLTGSRAISIERRPRHRTELNKMYE